MKKLYFATGNAVKITRAKTHLANLYEVETIDLDTVEPQTLDQEYVAKFKVQEAFKQLKQPVFAEDVGVYIEKYNSFPGVITKFVLQGIGLDGIKKLINEGEPAYYKMILAYTDGKNEFTVSSTMKGRLTIDKMSANYNKKVPFKSMFIPDGFDKPIADLTKEEDDKLTYSKETYQKFIEKLNEIGF